MRLKGRQSARPSLELGEGRAHTTRPHWRTAYLSSPPPPRSAQHKPWMPHASVGLRAHAFDMKHKHGCAGTSRTYLGHKHAEKDIIMCGRGAASGLRHDGIEMHGFVFTGMAGACMKWDVDRMGLDRIGGLRTFCGCCHNRKQRNCDAE